MSATHRVLSRLSAAKNPNSVMTTASIVLACALFLDAFSTSIVRLTLDNGMPPLVIIGIRLPLACLVFTPVILRRYLPDLRQITRKDLTLTLASGVLFAAQITLVLFAVDNTSILLVHVLLSTSLLFVAGMERIFLKARLHRLVLIGLVLALSGSTLIGLSSGETQDPANNSLWGMIAAITGAASGAGYMVIGRKVRQKVSAVPYLWIMYGGGAVFSTMLLLLTQTPVTGYSSKAYFWLAVLFVVVQIGLHSGINYVVKHFPATFISITGQIPTVLAAILAFFLFAEVPKLLEVTGSAIIISGVIVAILGQQKSDYTIPQ